MKKEIITYSDGSVYQGEIKEGKRHGQGKWTRPDRTEYAGQWKDDKPDGYGTLVTGGGSRYEGQWLEGRRNGEGTFTYPDGTILSGFWKRGEYAGESKTVTGQEDHCSELEKANWELKERIAELETGRGSKKKRPISFAYLKRFNLVMGILHFTQGLLMLFFALTIDQIKSFRPPVWSNFLEFDATIMRLVTKSEVLFEVPFALFVSFFLLLSALAHFIIVMPKTNEIYKRDLQKGINIFRWYEYSLSSSLMIFLIALLFGVYDIGALIAIFILNASMNLFGLLMEKLNQYTEKTAWSPFVFGCIAGIGPWIIIVMHALGNADPAEVPWFVYAIFGSYFVFFNLFPINMVLQYLRVGKWADYLYGERGYIVLSLVAKSVLAWLVFSGVMQPT